MSVAETLINYLGIKDKIFGIRLGGHPGMICEQDMLTGVLNQHKWIMLFAQRIAETQLENQVLINSKIGMRKDS